MSDQQVKRHDVANQDDARNGSTQPPCMDQNRIDLIGGYQAKMQTQLTLRRVSSQTANTADFIVQAVLSAQKRFRQEKLLGQVVDATAMKALDRPQHALTGHHKMQDMHFSWST